MIGVFLDTETNGLNSQVHKILEIAFQVIDLSTGEVKDSYQTVVHQPLNVWERSDRESLRINGFSWEEVSKGKPADLAASEIIACFTKWDILRKKAVFICQNPSFDRIFFSQLIDSDTQEGYKWPYHWLDLASMYWALAMNQAKQKRGPLPWETGFSKDLIAASYKLPTEAKPHRAMNGVSHLVLCYEAVVGFPNGATQPV
ncbi:MAG: DNA polymerase III subunit epsilon [Chlamydiae bacterium RIFCSPHIGHO2_12_FULL_49_9]|nr:MAG: DNA polymerase III subunit epsilon [Chlamydiae bacterium RIFCSPHIGHO2_12_FULL_49_9]